MALRSAGCTVMQACCAIAAACVAGAARRGWLVRAWVKRAVQQW